jgi:hypothetical protein
MRVVAARSDPILSEVEVTVLRWCALAVKALPPLQTTVAETLFAARSSGRERPTDPGRALAIGAAPGPERQSAIPDIRVEHIQIAEYVARLYVRHDIRLGRVRLYVRFRGVRCGRISRQRIRRGRVFDISNVTGVHVDVTDIGQRFVAANARIETAVVSAHLRAELSIRADAGGDSTGHAALDVTCF